MTEAQTLLSGFKKIYRVPIPIYKPSFIGMHFHDYRSVCHQTSCFIAFSGSTLTAQHVLNAVGNHLSDLRIGHEFADLSSGKVLCNIVLHSIRGALTEAKRHKVDEDGFKALLT